MSKITSPFEQNETAIPQEGGSRKKFSLWIIVAVILLVVGGGVGVVVTKTLNDPYRTLEAFPEAKYLEDYQPLTGSKFKANLHVEADLGWKDGVGRLMLFSTDSDSRPITVMIPAAVAKDIYFTKPKESWQCAC